MITHKNILEAFLGSRYWYYDIPSENRCFVFENMPEEGPAVRKRLAEFGTQEEAVIFLDAFKAEMLEHLKKIITVTAGPEAGEIPPLIGKAEKAVKAKKPKKKKKEPPPMEVPNTPSVSSTDIGVTNGPF